MIVAMTQLPVRTCRISQFTLKYVQSGLPSTQADAEVHIRASALAMNIGIHDPSSHRPAGGSLASKACAPLSSAHATQA